MNNAATRECGAHSGCIGGWSLFLWNLGVLLSITALLEGGICLCVAYIGLIFCRRQGGKNIGKVGGRKRERKEYPHQSFLFVVAHFGSGFTSCQCTGSFDYF